MAAWEHADALLGEPASPRVGAKTPGARFFVGAARCGIVGAAPIDGVATRDSLMPRLKTCALALLLAFSGACDSGPSEEEKKAADEAAAKKAAEEKEKEEAIAKRAEKRKQEKEAKEAEEAKIKAAVEAVAVIPEGAKLPKDLGKACDAVAEAHDGFVKRQYEGEEFLEKWEGGLKGTQLPMTKVQCNQGNSIKIAVCQKNALDNAGPELKEQIPDLYRTCVDKYADKGGDAGAIKAKPG